MTELWRKMGDNRFSGHSSAPQHRGLWARSPISRRGASTTAVEAGMSAHPQKQRTFSCVARFADGCFETAFVVSLAAPASGGLEPILPNAAGCTNGQVSKSNGASAHVLGLLSDVRHDDIKEEPREFWQRCVARVDSKEPDFRKAPFR